MFDSYIWDFDGTLFDTYPIMLDSMMKALEDRQVVADPKAVYRLLKEKSSKALTEKYHLDFREFSDDFINTKRLIHANLSHLIMCMTH
ncbi:Putative hydrolase, haloacid dehalogenase family [Enterococcus durans]|uniref:HAD hydrolase-like protein n=1 Tax=Enterococcus durans TaxID=53345 RepID=UPI000DF8FB93|nr:HAD hydrolase-like protein [Enterococcus durans]MDB1686533.1 HAD hydrolase-like protein [Enterococcus durans]STP37913.1 Putative hydrolase, haloacid dehalogenase family [Enterococcus durans]